MTTPYLSSTNKTTTTREPTEEEKKKAKTYAIMLLVGVTMWMIAGLIAFIMSLYCLGRSGSWLEHLGGVFIAFFFGPLYFIYYAALSSYCKPIAPK